MYPIVDGLIKNGVLKVEPTMENIVLVSIAALTITYLEESKNKVGDSEVPCDCKIKSKDCKNCGGTGMIKSVVTKQDARTILEELKLRGTKSEPLILQLIFQLLKTGGKTVLLIPNNFLFGDSKQHIETRKFIYENSSNIKIIKMKN